MLAPADVASRDDHEWTFNLTDHVKELLNQATLLLDGSGSIFYGFTDPKFTKAEKEIAYMISKEKLLSLFIEDTDKAWLANQGINMDTPQI
jgi:hypothetical protein